MKRILILSLIAGIAIISCNSLGSSIIQFNNNVKLKKLERIVFFNPEVYPNYDAITIPTNNALYSSIYNELKHYGDYRIMRIDSPIKYDSIDINYIKEVCLNNNAEVAVVPKIKYFKVGLGRYVFSNQVLISMKLYNNNGDLLIENSYDTYKGNGRLLGSAENSIKIGTSNVIKNMITELRKNNNQKQSVEEDFYEFKR